MKGDFIGHTISSSYRASLCVLEVLFIAYLGYKNLPWFVNQLSPTLTKVFLLSKAMSQKLTGVTFFTMLILLCSMSLTKLDFDTIITI